jgi:hypothetical protein
MKRSKSAMTDGDADMNTDMKVTSDDPTIPPVTDLEIGSFVPSEAAQGAAGQFLDSTGRSEAIRSLLQLPPDAMASILLACIPFQDSTNLETTKNKILQTLEYVKTGIQHRAKSQGVYFCNGSLHLPEEILIRVFGFLNKRDLIDNASHVSYAWAKASLSPNVHRWHYICCEQAPALGMSFHQIIDSGPRPKIIVTSDKLLQMLRRPQFAFLEKLSVPYRIKYIPGVEREHYGVKLTETSVEAIARACPRLQEFHGVCDTSYSDERLRELFPKMKSGMLSRTALQLTTLCSYRSAPTSNGILYFYEEEEDDDDDDDEEEEEDDDDEEDGNDDYSNEDNM